MCEEMLEKPFIVFYKALINAEGISTQTKTVATTFLFVLFCFNLCGTKQRGGRKREGETSWYSKKQNKTTTINW